MKKVLKINLNKFEKVITDLLLYEQFCIEFKTNIQNKKSTEHKFFNL